MKLSYAKTAIKEIYKTNSVTALVSERGVGKTSIYKQCAKELGIGYIDLYAAALEGPDFMGLPNKNSNLGITEYLAPRFLPTIESIECGIYPESGILVLEEINRVSSDTVSVLYPLLLDRKINGHILGDKWKIGVTMNPDNMNYLVNSLDDALIDRFITLNIEPDIKDYEEYSKHNNFNKSVICFLKNFPDMLLVINKSTSILKSPTPRGWTQVQELLNKCTFSPDILPEVISGIIGSSATAAFLGFIENYSEKSINPSSLLHNYLDVKEDVLDNLKNNKVEIITSLISSLILKESYNTKELFNINLFLNDLSNEFQELFYKEISLKNPELIIKISNKLDSFNNISDSLIDLVVG